MSVAALAIPNAEIFRRRESYSPVSPDSKLIHRLETEASKFQRGSAADWAPVIGASVVELLNECSTPGWDGEGSLAVSPETLRLAFRVAETLSALVPTGTPPPDIAPEPDGEISLSWSVRPARVYALSIGEHGKVNYSGQFGPGGSLHGWQPIKPGPDGDLAKSLGEIAQHVRRLYAPDDGRRPA